MTTSGTATREFDIVEIVEEAHDRAGVQLRGGYDYRSARRKIDLLMHEWANKGLNLWTVEAGTQLLTAGTAAYNLPADTVDLIEHTLRKNSGLETQFDRTLNRITVSQYSALTNKLLEAEPLQIYVARTITPSFTLWPVPDDAATYTVSYYRLRRIQDVGTSGANTMDVPFRFVPALVAGLAFQIAMARPEALARAPSLKLYYDEVFQLAADEDRDRSSFYFRPWVPRL